MKLRDYQQELVNGIYQSWETQRNVLAVAPCGAGKTIMFSHILSNHRGSSCAIAHRQELVSQMSLSLAKSGVMHRIISPKPLIHDIVQSHMEELGANFYNPSSLVAVAGVDTLIRRVDTMRDWMQSVTQWVTDESHRKALPNCWTNNP